MSLDPTSIIDPQLRRLYDYWAGKRDAKGKLPARADLDPAEIPALLPYVMLLDISHDPLDFKVRLAGTDICRRFGEEVTGKMLRQIDLDGETEHIFAQYAEAATSGQPRLDVQEFQRNDGRYMHYYRVILPLAADGTHVDMLLTGQRAIGIDGYPCKPMRLL